ncbi:MAG: C45 family autoproteolytic acyltransferase/hydrolase [Smithellaceae bacterium]|nr:C45 family autoproteolytic acyltransferase/hydrolase [Smithellaceae bacterium]
MMLPGRRNIFFSVVVTVVMTLLVAASSVGAGQIGGKIAEGIKALSSAVQSSLAIPKATQEEQPAAGGQQSLVPAAGLHPQNISPDDYAVIKSYGKSSLRQNSAGKKLLYLEGSAYERGYAEGFLCPQEVYRMTHDFIDYLVLQELSVPASPSDLSVIWTAVRNVLIQAAQANQDAVPKAFRDEMQGMAAACQDRGYDVSYEEILTLNTGYDALESLYMNLGAVFLCNEFAVFGQGTTDGRLYHGRDFMFPTGNDTFSDVAMLIAQKPEAGDGYPFVASAAPGFVGIPTGLNTKGVSIGVDVVYSVFSRPVITSQGCLLLCRQVTQYAGTKAEGISFIRSADRAVPWLYLIADGKMPDAAVLETAASRMIPPGDTLINYLGDAIPGMNEILAGTDDLLPIGFTNAAGQFISAGSDIFETMLTLTPGISDLRPDRGMMVRPSDYVDPANIAVMGINYLPDQAKGQLDPYFPKQQESYADLVAMTNHYILPQMAASNPSFVDQNADSKSRYDTQLGLLMDAYGSIEFTTAIWIIDFLNPSRCDYYGTDTTQSVKGHHVLMDNYSLEMWSLHGYYNQPWAHADLKKLFGLPTPPDLNKHPVAKIAADKTAVKINEQVNFSGSTSSDPDGYIVSFNWDFGDGTTANVVTPPAHTYSTVGVYAVKLTVTDDKGSRSVAMAPIAVSDGSSPTTAGNDYSDPAYAAADLKNMYEQCGRVFDQLADPNYALSTAQELVSSYINNLVAQLLDPTHPAITAGFVVPGWDVGEPAIRAQYQIYVNQGRAQEVRFRARTGALLYGQVWRPAEPGKYPAISITPGSVQADSAMYWWAAEMLADHGYIVLTFDAQGQGRSDTLGHTDDGMETPTMNGVPSQQEQNFLPATVDAVEFLLSTPAKPYRWAFQADAASGYTYNPYWSQIEYLPDGFANVGIAGHSFGAQGVTYAQDPAYNDMNLDNIRAVVAWDNLSETYTPHVPSMGQNGEAFITTQPNFTRPDPESKKLAFNAWRTAAIDTMQIAPRAATHMEWCITPPITQASSWGNDIAQHYTLAWFDKYLKHDPTADTRLLTKQWNTPGRCADEPNCYSIYYKSAYSFHKEGSAGKTDGAYCSCDDVAHIVNEEPCPLTDPN